ncbi:MAG: hypothetical protein LKF60_07190 [Megasphaera sp.]|jgi:tRNA A-37 threonylcarbamoyl transferase component Bud32|nr:hypothetical protein [Megasphaera sp.]
MISSSLYTKIQQTLQEQPKKRVLSFTWEEKKYFIKRRISNGRNTFAKQNTSAAFWCEAYKIMTVRQYAPLAPAIVLLTENYFVMESCGKTMQGVAKEAPWQEVRLHAFEKAGCSLALLHQAGLHHGRPALRDIAYDKENDTITFIDWENEKTFVSLDTKALDIFLFIHSCFREKWSVKDSSLIDAALKGYTSVQGSDQQIRNVKAFIHKHHLLFHVIHNLRRFGWKDVTAVDNARLYIDALTF